MHSNEEAALLTRLAAQARRVVEIGVNEGGSAVVLAQAMPPDGELHLIDPFEEQPATLRVDGYASARSTRRVLQRVVRRGGPHLSWHVTFSQRVATSWQGKIDLLFIDGDHSMEGCRRDWDLFHPYVSPGGRVAFHDARLSQPGGRGAPGPTEVVDGLLRAGRAPAGWAIETEVDSTVVARRAPTAM